MVARSTGKRCDVMEYLAAPVTPLADDSIAFLVTSLARRLNRGTSDFYLEHFGIGLADFRVLLTLGLSRGLNVGAVALAADVDKAAASRSLRHLEERGLVQMEQTTTRGRAAIVHLTAEGVAHEREIRRAARGREKRFVASLGPGEREEAVGLIRKLIGNVPDMNKD